MRQSSERFTGRARTTLRTLVGVNVLWLALSFLLRRTYYPGIAGSGREHSGSPRLFTCTHGRSRLCHGHNARIRRPCLERWLDGY
jgi:hypothetical protein